MLLVPASRGFASHPAVLAGALLLVVAPSVAAQPASAPYPLPEAPEAHGIDEAEPAEIEAFLDGVMAAHLPDKRIAGATVAVVRDGEVLLTKGYGFADVDRRIRVDPERTLFRIGSVTKLFTWTAVMQLVEEGRIDLDADVNEYLDFEIPETFPEPITVRDLLLHTPGLEEDSRDLFTDSPEKIRPMGEWLPEHLPARVRPPGTFSAYSNYGTALAGYIVERVSDMSWDDYLEANILEPLGMTRTTGRQPLPEALEEDMSLGYDAVSGGWEAQDWEIITGAAPAGSMSSTAADMARFMIAHLQDGELEGARILEPETVREMHARQFAHDEHIPGFGLGFYEKSSHGVRIVGHGGNTRWFHTDLALFPEHDLGIFVSYNSSPAAELSAGPFLTTILDRYFASETPAAEPSEHFAERVGDLTGSYWFNRANHTTFQKAMGLVSQVSVEAGDGVLVAQIMGPTTRFVEEGPLRFREEMGERRLAFRVDDSGRATHAFVSDAPMMALERVPWHGLQGLHVPILGAGLLVFLGTLLAAGIRWARRWWGSGPEVAAGSVVLGRRAMVAASAAFVGFAVWAAVLASDPWELLTGSMLGLRMALALPVLGLLAALAGGAALIRAIRTGDGGRWARIRMGGSIAVALAFTWSLYYWNLLGWHF